MRAPILFLAAILLAFPHLQAQVIPPTSRARVVIPWNHFHDFAEMTEVLRTLERASDGWMRLESIGRSVEGRELWLATLAKPGDRSNVTKPAMWIDANIHGNETQGTEVALYTLWYLLENRERLPMVQELLARSVFFVLPTLNPDGREWWIHGPNTEHSSRTGKAGTDNDRDGAIDEDGPDDLDGDGSITTMRMRVTRGGTHIIDPDDERFMKRVKPGTEGTHVLLGAEGIDNDGDGAVNEDGPGGYDMNRNWPSDWQPDWIQGGAGPYPFCWPETEAVGAFLRAHPNIAALQSYHNNGGMILRGPGAESAPAYSASDINVFDALGKAGEKMLPHYRYMIIWKDLYTVHGGSITWAFENLGIFGFTNELWADGQYGVEFGDREEFRKERTLWDERLELGRNLRPWKPFTHPVHGPIEVGGFAKTVGRVPPPFMLEELCHRNTAFTLHCAAEMPRLSFGEVHLERVDGELWKLRAEVRNAGLIPTIADHARRRGVVRPDIATVSGALEIVAAGRISGPVHDEKFARQEHRPERLLLPAGIPSQGRVTLQWFLKGSAGAAPKGTLRIEALKGGVIEVALPEAR